jgi:hypothetical protein
MSKIARHFWVRTAKNNRLLFSAVYFSFAAENPRPSEIMNFCLTPRAAAHASQSLSHTQAVTCASQSIIVAALLASSCLPPPPATHTPGYRPRPALPLPTPGPPLGPYRLLPPPRTAEGPGHCRPCLAPGRHRPCQARVGLPRTPPLASLTRPPPDATDLGCLCRPGSASPGCRRSSPLAGLV